MAQRNGWDTGSGMALLIREEWVEIKDHSLLCWVPTKATMYPFDAMTDRRRTHTVYLERGILVMG